jgi:hypothetical protein
MKQDGRTIHEKMIISGNYFCMLCDPAFLLHKGETNTRFYDCI